MKSAWLAICALAGLGPWPGTSAQTNPQPKQLENWPSGPCEFSPADPLPAAQKCQQLADAGDADAMYQFWTMLITFAPDPARASPEEIEKWKPVGHKLSGAKWLDLAAEKGNQPAIRIKCQMGKDRLAPAARRAEGQKWCAKMM